MSGYEGDADAPSGQGTAWRIVTLVAMALLGVAVLVALIVTLGEANRQRDRALQLQSHSYGVMILARTLAGTIAQSEAALGRYVISGDKQLGRRYADQWQTAGEQIDLLDRVTDDNAEQQPRIDRLRAAYRVRGAELGLIAASTNYRKNDQALGLYYQASDAASLAEINHELDAIIAREHILLDARTGAAMASVAQSTVAARILAVFGILLVLGAIALGWLIVQALGERAVARAEADAERERAAELESAVAQATAELRAQEARLRQVQKMEAIGQLTGGIAHDFNNMLAVVLGGLELARRQVDGADPVARHIDNAAEGANRAAVLTRRLLAFSREEQLHSEPFAPGALIAGMSDLLDRTLGDAIVVDVQDTSGGWLVRSDRHQLENVILNLAVNARDAMEGRGRLTVATGRAAIGPDEIEGCAAGDYVSIAVADSGCGMAPETLERVFEPFFTTKPVGKGTGLGLSQAFAFARQAEGAVSITSQAGAGTVVTLHLPRLALAAAAPAGPAPPAEKMAGGSDPLDILVVEDDPRVLAATIGALEELGHRPHACDDPLAAPALLDRHPEIALIVSDVLMPGQTGPEMAAALASRFGHVAVLFVTGYAGQIEEADFGGHPVLRKPFTIAALDRVIGQAMATQPAPPESIAAE